MLRPPEQKRVFSKWIDCEWDSAYEGIFKRVSKWWRYPFGYLMDDMAKMTSSTNVCQLNHIMCRWIEIRDDSKVYLNTERKKKFYSKFIIRPTAATAVWMIKKKNGGGGYNLLVSTIPTSIKCNMRKIEWTGCVFVDDDEEEDENITLKSWM